VKGCRIDFETTVGASVRDEDWRFVQEMFEAVRDEARKRGLDADRVIQAMGQTDAPEGSRGITKLLDEVVQREAKRFDRKAERAVRQEEQHLINLDRMEQDSKDGKSKIDALNRLLYNEVGGPGDNLELMRRSYKARWVGRLEKGLDKITGGRYASAFKDRRLRLDVIREYDAHHKGAARATKNNEAYEIAKLLHEIRDHQRATLNRLGSRRSWQRAGLPMRWSWSRIQNSRDDFVKLLADSLNEATHGNATKREGIARSIYDRLSESKGILDFDRLGDVLGEDVAPVLDWARGDAWISLNDRFGDDDFIRTVIREVEHLAGKESAMRRFGRDADRNFARLLAEARKAGARHRKVKRAEARYDRLTKTFIPDHIRLSRYLGAARNVETASKLGSAILAAITDIPVLLHRMRQFNNVGLFDGIRKILSGLRKENRDYARYLGSWAEGAGEYVHNRFGAGSELDDRLSRGTAGLADTVMRLSGLNFWTGALKAAGTAMLDAHLGKLIRDKTTWAALPSQLKAQLQRFQIGESDWRKLKARHVREDGRFDLFMMPDEETNGLSLKHKLLRFYIDAVESGVLTPGMRDQELIGLNQLPGRFGAEMAKVITQFTSFAVSAHRRLVYRTLKEDRLRWNRKITGLSTLMVFALVMNGISIQTRETLKGNQPYEFDREELWTRAALQLPYGLLVDTFMKLGGDDLVEALTGYEGMRFESNTDLLGPIARDVRNILSGVGKIAKGDTEKGLSKISKTALQLVPGQNIWWGMAAYRAGVIDTVTEWIDPKGYRGSKRAAERRAREQRQGGQLRSWIGKRLD
jgi:hypothetical protein